MPQESQLDQTQRLLAAVMGTDAEQTGRFDDVRKAFGDGKSDVVVELPWYEDGSTHQLILTKLQGDRAYFINPLGHVGSKAGAVLQDGGLQRRVEEDNTESAAVSDLEKVFGDGKARALIPR